MSLPNDNYGRSVSMVTTNGQDVYTISGSGASFTMSFPSGTAQDQVYNSINSQAPASGPLTVPLNQQYTPTQYGNLLIAQFSNGNVSRGLTTSQIFTAAQTLTPYFILLQTGSLETCLANLPNIPVDGVIITSAVIAEFTEAIEAYLAGD